MRSESSERVKAREETSMATGLRPERLTGSGVFKSAWLVSSSYDEEKKRLDVDVMARFEPKAASSKVPSVPQVKNSPTQ